MFLARKIQALFPASPGHIIALDFSGALIMRPNRRSKGDHAPLLLSMLRRPKPAVSYWASTFIFLALDSSAFGRVMVSTPSLRSALILPASTSAGTVSDLWNAP